MCVANVQLAVTEAFMLAFSQSLFKRDLYVFISVWMTLVCFHGHSDTYCR